MTTQGEIHDPGDAIVEALCGNTERPAFSREIALSNLSRARGLAASLEHPATADGKALWTDNGIRAVAAKIGELIESTLAYGYHDLVPSGGRNPRAR